MRATNKTARRMPRFFPMRAAWQTRETEASIFQTGCGRGTYQISHCEKFDFSGFRTKQRMNEERGTGNLATDETRIEHGKGRGPELDARGASTLSTLRRATEDGRSRATAEDGRPTGSYGRSPYGLKAE